MIRALIITLILLIPVTARSQGQINYDLIYYSNELLGFDYIPIRYTPVNYSGELIFREKNGNGKEVKVFYKEFNNSNLLVKYREDRGKTNPFREATFSYNEAGKPVLITIRKNGKEFEKWEYTWNAESKNLSEKQSDRHSKIQHYCLKSYKDEGCPTQITFFKKGGEKESSRLTYEYASGCSLSKSEWYKSGRLKKTWTYDCNSQGEALEKKKDMTQVCRWENLTSDTLTKTTQSLDEKGRTIKQVAKYSLRDTALYENRMYNHEGQCTWIGLYNGDYNLPLSTTRISDRKIHWQTKYTYRDSLVSSMVILKRDKEMSRKEYLYDEKLFLTGYRTIRKGNTEREIVISYPR